MLTTKQLWDKTEAIIKAAKKHKNPGFEKYKVPFHRELKGESEGDQNLVMLMLMVANDPKNDCSIRKGKEKIKLKAFEIFNRFNDLFDLVANGEGSVEGLLDLIQEEAENEPGLPEHEQILVFGEIMNLVNVRLVYQEYQAVN